MTRTQATGIEKGLRAALLRSEHMESLIGDLAEPLHIEPEASIITPAVLNAVERNGGIRFCLDAGRGNPNDDCITWALEHDTVAYIGAVASNPNSTVDHLRRAEQLQQAKPRRGVVEALIRLSVHLRTPLSIDLDVDMLYDVLMRMNKRGTSIALARVFTPMHEDMAAAVAERRMQAILEGAAPMWTFPGYRHSSAVDGILYLYASESLQRKLVQRWLAVGGVFDRNFHLLKYILGHVVDSAEMYGAVVARAYNNGMRGSGSAPRNRYTNWPGGAFHIFARRTENGDNELFPSEWLSAAAGAMDARHAPDAQAANWATAVRILARELPLDVLAGADLLGRGNEYVRTIVTLGGFGDDELLGAGIDAEWLAAVSKVYGRNIEPLYRPKPIDAAATVRAEIYGLDHDATDTDIESLFTQSAATGDLDELLSALRLDMVLSYASNRHQVSSSVIAKWFADKLGGNVSEWLTVSQLIGTVDKSMTVGGFFVVLNGV